MTIKSIVTGISVVFLGLAGLAVTSQPNTPKQATAPASASVSSKLVVAPELAQRVAKFRRVHMPFNSDGLTEREKKMVSKLVDASGLLDCIFWRQSDQEGLRLYLSLANSTDPQDELLRRYLKINGGRFELIENQKPFVGTEPMPPGRGFYHLQVRWESWMALGPEPNASDGLAESLTEYAKRDKTITNPYTIVSVIKPESGQGLSKLVRTVPYHVEYAEFLKPMAKDLREAADLSDDPAFARFLRLRADALLTDDYYASDIAWLDLQNPRFDISFAPMEVYLDSLLGVKTSYGASVMIRNEEESRKLATYQKYVPALQDALPLPPEDRPSKHGHQTPMEVMDAPFRAGDLLHGYQAVADNLPNDPRVHEQKGSKKLFWKNFMDARVNYVILPLAKRVMRADQAEITSGEGYLADTIMHEIAHELGPLYSRTAQGKVGLHEALGPRFSGLEEAKADVVGQFCLQWLVDHGAYPKEKIHGVAASYVAGIFRTIRFGVAEAHSAGEMMQFNYLSERGAIRRNSVTGLYEIDFDRLPAAMASLAKELLEQEATGDRARAEAWFKKYAVMPPELAALLAKTSDIPVDIDPEFDFNPPVR
ncbi:MAG TPA: Zn-dependent hydrolase [Candidatus Limnocylindria bacterium]|nr:Zn-dependent hydrolase [Candidatus Limnocylindria bacterium]